MLSRFCASVCSSVLLVLVTASSAASGQQPDELQEFLEAGRLNDAATAMQAAVDQDPNDHQSRFSLGVVQFLQAVEGLGYDHYRYGLLAERRRQITFMRLPVPENKNPEQLSYAGARQILQNYADGLAKAEATLSGVKPVGLKLPLAVGKIRLDLNRDGTASESESLWSILLGLQGFRGDVPTGTSDTVIAFDDADVLWLRGYCHVMGGLAEIALAYNWEEQFHCTAHLFYPNVDSPYPFLAEEGSGLTQDFNIQNILDVVALIHTANYEVVEPQRMQVALSHFESVIQLSRESWKLIEAETDNDREWIPNARQTSAMGDLRVGQGMIRNWSKFLDEMELILQGKKLLPFWRGARGGTPFFTGSIEDVNFHPTLGINVRRIFTEPKRLDAMLWLQGTGLAPFLEEGPRVDLDTFQEIAAEFNGNFLAFMIWFN